MRIKYFSIFQQSLSGSIERVCLWSDYDEVPWYQLRAQSVLRLISNSLIDIGMSSGKAKTVFLLELILKLF